MVRRSWRWKGKEWTDNQKGFTLVELMATITILAIITIPLLSYFSQAAKHNADSRTKQNAVITAQDVLEVFKAAPYEVTSGGAVKMNIPEWNIGVPDADGKYVMDRDMEVDNQTFQVEAEVTPVKEQVNSVGDTVTYQRSVLGSMDTAKDLLAAEGSSMADKAAMYYYQKHAVRCTENGTTPISDSEFLNYVDRTIVVDVKASSSEAEDLIVSVIYQYTFSTTRYLAAHGSSYPVGLDASTAPYEEVVEARSLNADTMNNIYLFYKPFNDEDKIVLRDNGEVRFNTEVASRQLSLYIVAQSSVAYGEDLPDSSYTNRPASYKMNIEIDGSFFADKIGRVYTNLSNSGSDEMGVSVLSTKLVKKDGKYTLVDLDPDGAARLADIKVVVSQNGKQYAEVTGVKVQH